MGKYKGIDFDDKLTPVIPYMSELDSIREELSILAQQWDLLTILGQITGGSSDMTATRSAFNKLTIDLLGQLGEQTFNKTLQQLSSKAQVTVDIVMRNLFERTADIGFLATDDDIRLYLKEFLHTQGQLEEEQVLRMKKRFQEYVDKYSVYKDIVLLDTNGNIACRLNTIDGVTKSQDTFIQESVNTISNYLESYGESTLFPNKEKQLVYSFKVKSSNDSNSETLGVLCLFFKFEDELNAVFKNLLSENDWTVLTLIDNNGQVLASSDSIQVPVNSKLEMSSETDFKISKFNGKLYLVKTCPTKGYQGYMGLGWCGQAMIPVEYAFQNTNTDSSSIDRRTLEIVTKNKEIFPEKLLEVPVHASLIQSELNRTVWNGNLETIRNSINDENSTRARKVLLWEISTAGNKTKTVFEKSIDNLYKNVIESIQDDMKFISHLAIDIMDRNLYERANDCRWWALNSTFREILSQEGGLDQSNLKTAEDIITYINSLYTVYTNIILFDKNGKILAMSNSSEKQHVNTVMGQDFIKQTLQQTSSNLYSVSGFDASHYYGQQHTYIYSAPIIHAQHEGQCVGGIAVVFNGKKEFFDMLKDTLPLDKNKNLIKGCFSLFVEKSGKIVASTNDKYQPGQMFTLPSSFNTLHKGQSLSTVFELDGTLYSLGTTCSKGYREYKGENCHYKNEILALCFYTLGDANAEGCSINKVNLSDYQTGHVTKIAGKKYIDVSTFFIHDNWFGIKAEHVKEAVLTENITKLPAIHQAIEGTIVVNNKAVIVLNPYNAMNIKRDKIFGPQLIVVVQTDTTDVGIIVDQLGEIPEIDTERFENTSEFFTEGQSYIESIIKPQDNSTNSKILVVLSPTNFVKTLLGNCPSALSELKKLSKSA